jgi:hypothetical protein
MNRIAVLLIAFSGAAAVGLEAANRAPQPRIQFNRDIRPILSDKCFACHGHDNNKVKANLRLDVRDRALQPAKSGKVAVTPGKPDQSELVARILTADADEVMPPPASHKALTSAEKELLRRWIAEGAAYQGHWSYEPPVKAATPAGRNGIDVLVQQHLKDKGLKPVAEADRRTLARRVYSDLVGLPPSPEEVEAFVQDRSADAYERLVDRLMASPHFGERMALGWLDVVRFADTIGYHSDNPRNIWPYRDYVIRAFNSNKPFDRFTREQVAGDLLPAGGLEQKVASGFNRLLLSTEEGGAQAKDYEARMLTDRVRAVSTVWLGQTFGCAQCHDHKFDPVTLRDFYSMGAFFADISEPIIGRREDGMLVPDEKQAAELARLEGESARLQREFDAPHEELAASYARWLEEQAASAAGDPQWMALLPASAKSAGDAKLTIKSDKSVLASGSTPDKDTYTVEFAAPIDAFVGLRLEALPDGSLPAQGPGRAGNGNFVITEIVARIRQADGMERAVPFARAQASFEQTFAGDGHPDKVWNATSAIDGDARGDGFGWAILPEVGRVQRLVLELKDSAKVAEGERLIVEIRQNHGHANHTLGRFRIEATASRDAARSRPVMPPPKEILEILAIAPERREAGQKEKLSAHYRSICPELGGLRQKLAEARKARSDYEAWIPRTLVSSAMEQPRTVRILPRGNFLVETGDVMSPAFPTYLAASAPRVDGRRLNRLDLANWLVSRDNPLTARVVMNRWWKQFFGIGLSRVLDDFGAQGEPPVHPGLLDWLACEFMDSGWDVKHMVRLMVTSRTYRQASTAPKDLLARDPYNRELARQGRWRVEAELVRDQALAYAGLLTPRIGGPSVKPYQPEGYWENLNFPQRGYDASAGADQYRRGLYVWWQRSFLHPSLQAFDAPSREECAAERNRSNIPQQALVLLNDPTYVEAARGFAARIVQEGGRDTSARIQWAWKLALSRAPRADELKVARALFEKHLAEYRQDQDGAAALLKVGLSAAPAGMDPAELAAWMSVARVILNLHEVVTRS